MSEQKKEIHFHILHSMKGGCGKSTCALFKTLRLANEALNKLNKITGTEDAEVLFLDADFKGSAMQALLFRDTVKELDEQRETTTSDEQGKKKTTSDAETVMGVLKRETNSLGKGKEFRHIIAIPNHYRLEDNLSRYLREPDVPFSTIVQKTFSYMQEENLKSSESGDAAVSENHTLINGYIDFILAAVDSDSKNWFRNNRGKIAPGVYLHRMKGLLEQALYHNASTAADDERSKKPLGQYANVVIDMPPGYDEYSDMLLDLLREMATKDEQIKLHYYAVTTEDIGHMKLTKDNIKKVLENKTEYKPLDEVNVILSNPFSEKPAPKSTMETDRNIRIGEHISALQKLIDEKGKVYRNEYNTSFHEYSTNMHKDEFELDENDTLKGC